MGRTTNPSGQLDLVELLSDRCTRVEDELNAVENDLNPQIDANPDDKLLMEMLDVVTDARESVGELRDLLTTMQRRDAAEEIP